MDSVDFGRESSKSIHVGRPVNVSPPAGLQAIYATCRRIYPEQPNPLQVTAVVKYWFGGPDPLDYISMYVNNGDVQRNIPAHWHYVTFGLSDLHGDGRVHDRCAGPDGPSGFGFELTFRLRREPGETAPPTWPAALLQALAKYVFQSGNNLCPGDHIPWRRSLDGSESRIQHMLMASDPQLDQIVTPFGTVNFVQVVGVCEEELKVAQQWNGPGVLNLIQTIPRAGGPWLVTDMRRGETIFEIDPTLQEQVDAGIEIDGSNLSGVSGQCLWEDDSSSDAAPLHGSRERHSGAGPNSRDDNKENSSSHSVAASASAGGASAAAVGAPGVSRRRHSDKDHPRISHDDSEQIKTTLKKGLVAGSFKVLPPIKPDGSSGDSSRRVSTMRKGSLDSTASTETLSRTRTFDAVRITLNLETGCMLPLALRGRLKHGRHFTFKSAQNEAAVTLVPCSVVGSIATDETPFAAHGPWLQVLLRDDFIDKMLVDLADFNDLQQLTSPRVYSWADHGLTISLLPDKAWAANVTKRTSIE